MPPLPNWFRGRDDIAAFMAGFFEKERRAGSIWRYEATTASGQHALAGHRRKRDSDRETLDALVVIGFDGELVADVTTFMGVGALARVAPPGTPTRTDEFQP
jgi:hypothetical protein